MLQARLFSPSLSYPKHTRCPEWWMPTTVKI